MNRTKKKLNKERRLAGLRDRRWHRLARVLRPFGLTDEFWKLDEKTKEHFWRQRNPPPVITINGAAQSSQQAVVLQAALENVFTHGELKLAGATMTAGEFCTLFTSVPNCFASTLPLPKAKNYFDVAEKAIDNQYATLLEEASSQLEWLLTDVIDQHSHFDQILFSSTWRIQICSDGKAALHINITATPAEGSYAVLDGQYRQVYRCAAGSAWRPFEWVKWPTTLVGKPGGPEYPVYTQRHTIERLHERLPLPGVNFYLGESLKNPKLIQQDMVHYLVEYRYQDNRLGYLLAEFLSDKVVLRTFLFLTMQGTPEARQLYEKFHLCRPDIEYYRLDTLHPFVETDIQHDATLVKLFTECGCGHLLELTPPAAKNCLRTGYAAALREYLGIPSNGEVQRIG